MGVAMYGSLVFQLKDAHLEANGTCDFVFRALRVVSKTTVVTVFLACLSSVPVLMFIFGEYAQLLYKTNKKSLKINYNPI